MLFESERLNKYHKTELQKVKNKIISPVMYINMNRMTSIDKVKYIGIRFYSNMIKEWVNIYKVILKYVLINDTIEIVKYCRILENA